MKNIYPHFFDGENADEGTNVLLSTLYAMGKHVFVGAFFLWYIWT